MIEGMTMGILLMLGLGSISGLAIWKRDKVRNPQQDCSTCTFNRQPSSKFDRGGSCCSCELLPDGIPSHYKRGFGIR